MLQRVAQWGSLRIYLSTEAILTLAKTVSESSEEVFNEERSC